MIEGEGKEERRDEASSDVEEEEEIKFRMYHVPLLYRAHPFISPPNREFSRFHLFSLAA